MGERRVPAIVVILLVTGLTAALVPGVGPSAAQTPTPTPTPAPEPGDDEEPESREEVESERTAYSKTYREPDGTYTAEVSTEQIHFKDVSGSWRDVDTTLVPCDDGCAYRVRRGPVEMEFASNGSSRRLVSLGHRGRRLSFGLNGGAPTAPVAEENRITYPEVLPGVDLVFEARATALKELIVLHAPPRSPEGGPLRYRFPLGGTGLTARETERGEVQLLDETGDIVFTMPRIFMYDSSGDDQSREPAFTEKSTIGVEDRGGTQFVVVTPDSEWLDDPERVYPVYVDPSVTQTPTKDTFIQSNIQNTRQDGSDELKAGTYDGGSTRARSLIRFDIHQFKGTVIKDARLSVRNFHSWSCDNRPLEVRRIKSDWPAWVTWPDRPSLQFDPVAKQWFAYGYANTSECSARRVEFNLTNTVQNWADLKWENYGVALRATNESDNHGWKKFRSADSNHPPKLIVNYNTKPKTPTARRPADGAAVGATPTLSAVYDDPDPGDGGFVDFRIFNPDGTRLYPNDDRRGSFAEPGQRSSWTFPSGTLEHGKTYTWKARSYDHNHYSGFTSNAFSFTVDKVAPGSPSIDSAPDDRTNDETPTWTFSGEAGALLECRLLQGTTVVRNWGLCASPHTYDLSAEPDAAYTFEVRQEDAAGNVSDPASDSFTLDRVAPGTPEITSAPSSPSTDATPVWEFSGSETGGTFECRLATGSTVVFAYDACTSPHTHDLAGQPAGTYTFGVRQRDAAGNASSAATDEYVYDPDEPVAPTVTGDPHENEDAWYRSDDPAFSWTIPQGSQPASGVDCYSWELDRDASFVPPESCSGTATRAAYENVGEGRHWFHVRARSGAGAWGQTRHFRIQVDFTDPGEPRAVVSPSHVPRVAFRDRTIEVTWIAPDDTPSGVAGYSYSFEREVTCDESVDGAGCHQGATADETIDPQTNGAGKTRAESATLDAGTYWFHVKAIDKAGNASGDVVYGPLLVDPQNGAPIPLAPSLDDLLVAQSDENGREQFYPYDAHDLGSPRGFVQLHSGNLVAHQKVVRIPRQGLNAVVGLTYNAHRSDPAYHDTGVGRGWVLSLSDLDAGLDFAQSVTDIDLNSPVLPTTADVVDAVAGATGGLLELTDGDGTVHRFVRKGDPGTKWTSPPGVNLQVEEQLGATGLDAVAYHLVRPDGVRYIARQPQLPDGSTALTWHVVEIRDRNGNSLSVGYDRVGDATSLLDVRAQEIRHTRAGSSTAEVLVRLDYAASGLLEEIVALPGKVAPDPSERDLSSTSSDDRLRSYERHVDLTFAERRLEEITEAFYTESRPLPEHAVAAERSTVYGYTTYDDPDLLPGPYPLLTSVTDALQHRTTFGYDDGSATGARRVTEVHDRRKNAGTAGSDAPWTYSYEPADPNTGERTTVGSTPLDAETRYRISGRNRIGDDDERVAGANILEITSPPNDQGPVVETFVWDANRLVERRDATGAATRQRYDDLGLLVEITGPPPNDPSRTDLPARAPRDRIRTQLTYRYGGGGWSGCSDPGGPAAGDHCASFADMTRMTTGDVVTAESAETSQRRRVDLELDDAGNLTSATLCARTETSGCDPDVSRTTTFDHYVTGALKAIDGPRRLPVEDVTTFGDTAAPNGNYHPSGMPRKITDAGGNTTSFRFTPYGEAAWTNDRGGRVTRAKHDELGRPVWTEAPDGARTKFEHDLNGNRTARVSPRGVRTEWERDANEWQTTTTTPGVAADDAASVSKVVYNADGTVSKEIDERGVEVAAYEYYPNQQVKTLTTPAAGGVKATTTYFYDAVGRERRVVLPATNSAGANPVRETTYTPQGLPARVTETAAPDANGSRTREIRHAYNAHGEQIELDGPRSKNGVRARQEWRFNSFGELTSLRRLVEEGRFLEWAYEYDRAGNQVVTRKPYKVEQDLVSRFRYDALNRLVEQTQDPFNDGHTIEYTYLPEGHQKTRTDYHDDDADPATAPKLLRGATWTYNVDYTVRSMVRTDETGERDDLALCNYPAGVEDKSTGYNADDQPLVMRTLTGSAGCGSGKTVKIERFSYDARGWVDEITQKVSATGLAADIVTRVQTLEHRRDGVLRGSVWDGHETRYGHSDAGWMESATDWRSGAAASRFEYFRSGRMKSIVLGGGVASATLSYFADSSLSSLVWEDAAGNAVRSHEAISYDLGGFRTGEDVAVDPAGTSSTADTGGRARFDYDLAGRLEEWTSPFRLLEADASTDSPQTRYTLDDAGNITRETTTLLSDGRTARDATYSYEDGRLDTRKVTTTDLALAGETTVTDQAFFYTGLGQEKRRTSVTTADAITVDDRVTRSTYDPGGYTDSVTNEQNLTGGPTPDPDVDYLYDGTGQVIAKKRTTATGSRTRLYFYWRSGSQLAEETNAAGQTRVRYHRGSSGEPLAQQKVETTSLGTERTWTWLLTDPEGNVATHLRENSDGTTKVTTQRAYDPYGAPDEGGNSRATDAEGSNLGYQSSHTDEDTGNLLLGPRIYDPTVDRFTTADYLVGSRADLELGTDPLTGNRYLFAAANPVAFYENGYEPCPGGNNCNRLYSGTSSSNNRGWGPPKYDPADYEPRVQDTLTHFEEASSAFDVPISVLVATYVTEWSLDAKNRWEAAGEAVGIRALCYFPLRGDACRNRSVGSGQIQIRRAELVDEKVRDVLVPDVPLRGLWNDNLGAIYDRLRDERTNIFYGAAYLNELRDQHPAGTKWETVFGTRTDIGEWNLDPAFVAQFSASRTYYSRLDG